MIAAEDDLQHKSEIADARLGVAEEMAWPLALMGGTAAYLALSSWLLSAGVAIAVYVVACFRYRREADRAEDAYHRVARIGKYSAS